MQHEQTSLALAQILPALYNALGKAFDATPTELGYLTLSRALVQAFASPLGGIAGAVIRSTRPKHTLCETSVTFQCWVQ